MLSYNESKRKLEKDVQTDFIDQGIRKVIKLKFQDGREIKCTENHKFMALLNDEKDPKWIEAQNIPLNSKCLFGPDFPEDVIGDDEKDWIFVSESKIWSLNNLEEREKTLAFVRMLGFIYLNKKNCFGSIYDFESFNNDYELLFGEKNDQCLPILNEKFTKFIENFTTQELKLPDFILKENCPKAIVREYLAGLFGGDGGEPLLDNSVSFSWKSLEEHLPNLKIIFDQLKRLLKRFDIDCYINGPSYEKDNSPRYTLITESNAKFSECIGFRYCINKSYKLSAISCYRRIEKNIMNEQLLQEMNCLEWFTDKNKVDLELPYITMKLLDRSECGEENVFDISVKKSPSFVANGCVTHNSRVGVMQLISRLTYPATVSHLRRVVIPVGKEGKNVKIRQIDPSQVFFIDIIELTAARKSELKNHKTIEKNLLVLYRGLHT